MGSQTSDLVEFDRAHEVSLPHGRHSLRYAYITAHVSLEILSSRSIRNSLSLAMKSTRSVLSCLLITINPTNNRATHMLVKESPS